MSEQAEKRQYPSVSDLKPPSAIEGEYRQIKTLVGERLLIKGVKSLGQRPTPKGDLVETAVVKATMETGQLIFFYTGHTVLLDKLRWCFTQSPSGFVGTIVKEGSYYDIR